MDFGATYDYGNYGTYDWSLPTFQATGSDYGPGENPTPFVGSFSGTGGGAPIDWMKVLNQSIGLGSAGLGLAGAGAGVAQALGGGGGGKQTTTSAPNPLSPQQAALQNQLMSAVTGALNPTLMAALGMQVPGMLNQQAGSLGMMDQALQGTPQQSMSPGYQDFVSQKVYKTPWAQATPQMQQYLQQTQLGEPTRQAQYNKAAPGNQAMQTTMQGGLAQPLTQNILNMAQGKLTPLDAGTQSLIDQMYTGAEAQIGGFVDQSMKAALDRARQMGYAGGLEVFRDGTPGALLAPAMAEATRAKTILEGQKAGQTLGLQQQLPMQALQGGGQLMNMLSGAANAYNTPLGIRLQAPINWLNASNQMAGLGGTTSTTRLPDMGLLAAFQPLGQLLGGVGGALGGIGAFDDKKTTGTA